MRKEFKVGIFAIAVMVASFFLLNYLQGEDIFNREMEIVAHYEDVQGLVPSAPVFIKGYKAGKVTDVEYDAENAVFNVTCSVLKEFPISVDSKLSIYSTDIMGTKGVRIILGTSETMIESGDTLYGIVEPGLMDDLAEGLTPLLEKVSSTLDSLGTTVSGVNRLLSDANTSSISRTLKNLEQAVANVKDLSRTVKGKSEEINNLMQNLSDFSESLTGFASKADTTLTDINKIVSTVSEADLNGVVTSFKELLDNVNDPDGSIGKLLKDDSVYNSVDSLLLDLNVLVNKIQQNPKKYLKISVF